MPRTTGWLSAVVLACGLAAWNGVGAQPAAGPRRLLSGLAVGDAVLVREVGADYSITALAQRADEPALGSHRVVEVGEDFVAVVDVAGVLETQIPVYSIHAIVREHVPPSVR